MKRAFSLLEIIIAIFIIVLIVLLGVSALRSFKQASALNQAVQVVVSSLKTAQRRTVASQNLSPWGVHFATSSKVIIFQGVVFSSTTSTSEIFSLTNDATISAITLNNSTYDAVFIRPQGTTNNYGTIVVALKDGSDSRTVRVDQAGSVSVDTAAPPSVVNPNQDTRHVHVQLGFDIRTKTNMVLTFYDPPNPNTTSTVLVNDCLVQPGVFDCTREFVIGGSKQTIRVSTHYLDPSTTNLSINRDQRKNNKAVDIAFDSVLIVSYTASGSVSKGPDVLVGQPEIQ